MRTKKNFWLIFTILTAIAVLSILYLRRQEESKLKKEAYSIIYKIKGYKEKHGRLPEYLEDLHLDLPEDSPFSYGRDHDGLSYSLGYQTGFFVTNVYHSESGL